ncbi:MAG: hypothetical protein LC624_00695 [Halobacteriales archaeon]|nr:hypothetical protein [Halobacteriales archaeon]
MRRGVLLLPLLPLLLGPWGSALPRPAEADVTIDSYLFSPATTAIAPGGTVRWTNIAGLGHTVTSDTGDFDSGSIAPGDSFTVAFADLGTFRYHCLFHPAMQAKVVVADLEGLPDARIAGISVTDLVPGVTKSIGVTVRNDGLGALGATSLRLGYAYHGTLRPIGDADVPLLGPLGDTATATFRWQTAAKVGDFTLSAEADAAQAWTESDESNNLGQASTHVLVGGVPGIDLLEPLG